MADVPEIGLGVASTQEFNVQNHKKEGLKMKVLTFELFEEKDGGEVKIFPSSVIPDLKRFRPIGYFELEVRKDFLDITPPKKVVTKEAKRGWTDAYPPELNPGMRSVVFDMPYRAKNVKCTYDIEE